MKFQGALKIAEFFGKVSASQTGAQVTCHVMRVIFDRPVYFTQTNRPNAPAKPSTPLPNGQKALDDDKPKLDVVDCYPAAGDTADSPQERIVTFVQEERDPTTGRMIRQQRIEAQELRLEALARDQGESDPYRRVTAYGPGIVGAWAPGSLNDDAPGRPSPMPRPGQSPPGPAPVEMKLTIVNFANRMMAKDKGDRYKEATFFDSITAIHIPTDDPNLDVKLYQLPSQAALLTCRDRLVVWTVKTDKEQARQSMYAYGDAYIQNEEYEGSGEEVQSEGKIVRIYGRKIRLARIKSRQGGTEQAGETIVYDRATDYCRVDQSIGGTLTTPGSKTPAKGASRPVPKN